MSKTTDNKRKANTQKAQIDRKRLLDSLRNNIRFLTETDIEAIEAGNIEKLAASLNVDVDADLGRFVPKTVEDVENPDRFLLKIIRDPYNFPFTCEHIFNVKIFPFQNLLLRELWFRTFPMLIATRGGGKSYILALYAMIRALLNQGCKIVIVGSSFRQSKVIFEYCEKIWNNAPILRDICGTKRGSSGRENGPRRAIDRCDMIIGDSTIIALPIGDGRKIRGQRANYIIADEFASINIEIYETVIKGFGSVSQDPVASVEKESWVRVLKKLDYWDDSLEKEYISTRTGNQAVIAGTADYGFGDFARYWRRNKQIIETKGDPKKLADIVGNQEDGDGVNYRDYSIVRIPVDLIPYGFMDARYLSNTKATTHSSTFAMEYGTVFISDSDGFFKRSLILRCTCGVSGNNIPFEFAPQLRAEKGVRHIFAVDPASESDNFAVVILAVYKNSRRIVHVWTSNKKFHKERIQAGIEKDHNFYGYTARKIRNLMAAFPCERILVDSQGGGTSVREALHDMDKLQAGDLPIWEVIDPEDPKDEDGKKGLHILEMVNFSKSEWVNEANHGMKKDMEDGLLIFPKFDPIILELSYEEDKAQGRISITDAGKEIKLYDTLEDVYTEIEELKRELVTITHTRTPNSGRERWDTPTSKTPGTKAGKMRKDRYSALLMANMGARQLERVIPEPQYIPVGGFANSFANGGRPDGSSGNIYYGVGGDWIQSNGYSGGIAFNKGNKIG